MYSNLTLYYLNQLGITPWVVKSRAGEAEGVAKLAVLLPESISDKAQVLLKRMLDFVGLPYLLIHKTKEYTHRDNPLWLAVLVLGLDELTLQVKCPVFSSMDPDFLLENPLCKKQVLHVLSSVKEQISQ